MPSRLLTLRGFAPELFARADSIASIGTHAYPPAIRRRLKALNLGVIAAAVSCLLFAITYAFEDAALYRDAILVNLVLMLMALSVPAFHRFNEIAGTLFITTAFYIGLFALIALVGHESGIQINYIAASAALFPILDLKRIRLIALLIAVAIGLHVASWMLFPEGYVDADPRFLTQLYATVVATISIIIAVLVFYAFWTAERAEAATEALLHRILPAQVAERLKARPDAAISDSFAEASVLFSDIVDFVPITRALGAAGTVAMLNDLVHGFDRLAAKHGVEKIKTIGDAYMAAAGIPTPAPDHAARLAKMALGMQAIADETGARHRVALKLRIGIALGPVMAGVIGANRFGYDIWGDAVNLAARLENSGKEGKIHVSTSFRDALAGEFSFFSRGMREIKGVGEIETWFLIGEG
jgi:adenylate cyclase